ncbi:MAG: hypothetical protein A6D91_04675 [Bacillaceae bacterium G1]|nr:MAG: hypothetical protein A6D91_04675 [Bacillaceae bacterium G1]
MPFKIDKTTVSNKDWGSVDKSQIWQRLKAAIQENASGVTSVVREVYAVVKAPVSAELTQDDVWGPHHEIREDGTVVLNRAGLFAAAAALAGARSEPNLTPEEKRRAAAHLLRHYRELEERPPESLTALVGEMASVQAEVAGEMRVEDVPLAPWADIEALKSGDPDPMEVVVEIPAGRSKRGWNYRPEALQRIVGEVMAQGLPGYMGHMRADEVDHKFPVPVTHWVGAKWENGKAYFRGVIDKSAADLKRWIRGKAVRTVSIFGLAKLQKVSGETHVVDYKPISIDWTPLGRNGMPTRVVAVGEMADDVIIGEVADDTIITGGEDKGMNWKELVQKLRDMVSRGEVTVGQIVGEMGWTKPDVIAGEIDASWVKDVTGAVETLGKVKEVLRVSGEMDVVAVATEARKALDEKAAAERERMIDEIVKEKVAGEMAQALVKKMLHVPEGATKEAVAGEIDKLLADETIKTALSNYYTDQRPPISFTAGDGGTSGSVRSRKQAI